MAETIGSLVRNSLLNRADTLAAAAPPWATDSGMSLGPTHEPARKMPSVWVSTGRSLGWASMKKWLVS